MRGVAPPVCEHTSPAPNSAATAGSPGSAPAQVSLIRSAPAAHASLATLARQVSTLMSCSGYCGAQPFDERHHAGGLFVGVHLLAGTRLDPADVDDVGAFFDDAVRGGLGGLVGECGAAVVEGIGGAVDNGHDQGAIAGDRLAQERRLHGIQANGPVGADAETAVAAGLRRYPRLSPLDASRADGSALLRGFFGTCLTSPRGSCLAARRRPQPLDASALMVSAPAGRLSPLDASRPPPLRRSPRSTRHSPRHDRPARRADR